MQTQATTPEDSRTAFAEADVAILPSGPCWAVLDLRHRYREDGQIPLPEIMYNGLESREAAELARREVIGWLLDTGAPHGPSEVPVQFFDIAGRLLRFLRTSDVANAERLAVEMAQSAPWNLAPASPHQAQVELAF